MAFYPGSGSSPRQSLNAQANYYNKLYQVHTGITDFRDRIGELVRPNLFQVELTWPELVTSGLTVSGNNLGEEYDNAFDESRFSASDSLTELGTFLITSAALPSSTIGVIPVPFRGRSLMIAGDKTFSPFTMTVLNDQGFLIRTAFEKWSRLIQENHTNSCLLYTSPSPRDRTRSRMPSSA